MNTIEEEARHINMTIKVLKEQVAIFTSRLEPHDTGHIHTTISTLKHRIGELENERIQKMTKTSFGKYFDDQRDRIVKDMQNNKNTELYNAWREDFDKRQMDKKEKIKATYVDEYTQLFWWESIGT